MFILQEEQLEELRKVLAEKSTEIESLKTKPEVQNTGKIEELEDLNADLKLDLCETKDELEKIHEQNEKLQTEIASLKLSQPQETLESEFECQNEEILRLKIQIGNGFFPIDFQFVKKHTVA